MQNLKVLKKKGLGMSRRDEFGSARQVSPFLLHQPDVKKEKWWSASSGGLLATFSNVRLTRPAAAGSKGLDSMRESKEERKEGERRPCARLLLLAGGGPKSPS